jgi:hypothetical protein
VNHCTPTRTRTHKTNEIDDSAAFTTEIHSYLRQQRLSSRTQSHSLGPLPLGVSKQSTRPRNRYASSISVVVILFGGHVKMQMPISWRVLRSDASQSSLEGTFFTCGRLKEKGRIEYLYSLSNCSWNLLGFASLSNHTRRPSHRPDGASLIWSHYIS